MIQKIGFALDSPVEENGFEPLVQLQNRRNRGTGPMSRTAGIRVCLLIPLATSISISVASGTSGSNPPSSSGESPANLTSGGIAIPRALIYEPRILA
jgi:hypothetical protein